MIRTIVFDIGNVLVDYCWRDHIRGMGYEGETAERIGRAMMQSPVWNELDRGVWTDEELLAGFIANDPGMEEQIRRVFSDLSTLVRERSGSSSWVRSLKAEGYRVYYLSNFSGRVKREAADQLSFLNEMDGGIMSYAVRMIKPDPGMYAHPVYLSCSRLSSQQLFQFFFRLLLAFHQDPVHPKLFRGCLEAATTFIFII